MVIPGKLLSSRACFRFAYHLKLNTEKDHLKVNYRSSDLFFNIEAIGATTLGIFNNEFLQDLRVFFQVLNVDFAFHVFNVLFYQSCLSILEVINKKEQLPVICFGGKTFVKVLIDMLSNSVIEIVATAYIKPV
jgi:hypothetical protein